MFRLQKYTYPIYQPYGNKKKQVIREKSTMAVLRIYARRITADILKGYDDVVSSKTAIIISPKLSSKIYS
tara:strand:+ start:36809 stop:37018 length:210 start_codon:yes stop_codon:yes gene_type:complete